MSFLQPEQHNALAPYASAFAHTGLSNIAQAYPHKFDHLMLDASDLSLPQSLHPIFYGSFDWHSSVHMHWLLVRLLRCFPDLPEKAKIHAILNKSFTATNVAAEVIYIKHPSRQSFERTYGWAWLLKLQAELIAISQNNPDFRTWSNTLQPLANAFVENYLRFLPLANYPIRAGTHANSAFGLLFALDYAEAAQHFALRKMVVAKAHEWFGRDSRYPARYEPGGDDFLSPGLMEAALMKRVVDECSYADWWEVFCPAPQDLLAWLVPVTVSDRSDPKLAHLDGLNLSRAWCWKMLLPGLPADLCDPAKAAITAHLDAALGNAVNGHYAGTHWLASFALLAISQD